MTKLNFYFLIGLLGSLWLVLPGMAQSQSSPQWQLEKQQLHSPGYRLNLQSRYAPNHLPELEIESELESDTHEWALYRIHLSQILQHPILFLKPEWHWQDLRQYLGANLKDMRENYQQKPIWSVAGQKAKPVFSEALLPGAYVLESHAPGLKKSAAAVFVLSELELLLRQEPEQILYSVYYQGKAIENAELRIKVIYHCGTQPPKVRLYSLKSNAKGQAVFPLQDRNFDRREVEAFAFYQNNYAISERYDWKHPAAQCQTESSASAVPESQP